MQYILPWSGGGLCLCILVHRPDGTFTPAPVWCTLPTDGNVWFEKACSPSPIVAAQLDAVATLILDWDPGL